MARSYRLGLLQALDQGRVVEAANNEPVAPWENDYCESFNDCFRDEI